MTEPDKHALFSQWVNAHSDSLYAWAFHKTSSEEIAQDLVQDTFVSAYQSMDSFKEKSSPKTWLFSILKNKIIDHYRKAARTNMTSLDAADEIAGWFDENDRWKKEFRPKPWNVESENLLDDPEFELALSHCIENLPTAWQTCIQLKYLGERKGEDICQEMNITTSNLWQMMHRAKLQLRNCIDLKWFKK